MVAPPRAAPTVVYRAADVAPEIAAAADAALVAYLAAMLDKPPQ